MRSGGTGPLAGWLGTSKRGDRGRCRLRNDAADQAYLPRWLPEARKPSLCGICRFPYPPGGLRLHHGLVGDQWTCLVHLAKPSRTLNSGTRRATSRRRRRGCQRGIGADGGHTSGSNRRTSVASATGRGLKVCIVGQDEEEALSPTSGATRFTLVEACRARICRPRSSGEAGTGKGEIRPSINQFLSENYAEHSPGVNPP